MDFVWVASFLKKGGHLTLERGIQAYVSWYVLIRLAKLGLTVSLTTSYPNVSTLFFRSIAPVLLHSWRNFSAKRYCKFYIKHSYKFCGNWFDHSSNLKMKKTVRVPNLRSVEQSFCFHRICVNYQIPNFR